MYFLTIVSIKKYVDDGIGIHTMVRRTFNSWKNKVSLRFIKYGSKIKESEWLEPSEKDEPVNFLDIKIWFDRDHKLLTDLSQKSSESCSYISFNSYHPNYNYTHCILSRSETP